MWCTTSKYHVIYFKENTTNKLRHMEKKKKKKEAKDSMALFV